MRFKPKPTGRWKWAIVIVVPIVAFLIVGETMNTSPPTNIAQTAPDAAPELRTRIYSKTAESVFIAARKVALDQKTWFRSWRISTDNVNTIKVEVPVLFFTDDLTIHIDENEGKTRVNVESKSRVGQGDFGENRRHIAQFLRALDREIGDGKS